MKNVFLFIGALALLGCGDFGSSKIDFVLDQAQAKGGESKCEIVEDVDCDQLVKTTFSECCFEGECSKDLVSVSDASIECGGSVPAPTDEFTTFE